MVLCLTPNIYDVSKKFYHIPYISLISLFFQLLYISWLGQFEPKVCICVVFVTYNTKFRLRYFRQIWMLYNLFVRGRSVRVDGSNLFIGNLRMNSVLKG